jgi:hypothetical protein
MLRVCLSVKVFREPRCVLDTPLIRGKSYFHRDPRCEMTLQFVPQVYCPRTHCGTAISLPPTILAAHRLGPNAASISFPPLAVLCPRCRRVSVHAEAHQRSQVSAGQGAGEARLVTLGCDEPTCGAGIKVFVSDHAQRVIAALRTWSFESGAACANGHKVARPAFVLR